MTSLPYGHYENYIGIDPGYTGAIARVNFKGTRVELWDMPVISPGKAREREYDLDGLKHILDQLRRLPKTVVGLEWPSTRPDNAAEAACRFGRGQGYLRMGAHMRGFEIHRIPPNLWKGRLQLVGKTKQDANKDGMRLVEHYYSDFAHLFQGPRGGIKDGRLDAFLIAHFLRTETCYTQEEVERRFGRGSLTDKISRIKPKLPKKITREI